MSSSWRHLQKNAEEFAIKKYYENMTPEKYQEGIHQAIKLTEQRLAKEYNNKIDLLEKYYTKLIQDVTFTSMDTLAIEIVYRLGELLECYKDEPEFLDEKVDLVHDIYDTAMRSIGDYATDKYKSDKDAQKAFEMKRKTIEKIFNMYGGK